MSTYELAAGGVKSPVLYASPRPQTASLGPKRKKSLLDGMTSAQRKEYPITTGCIDYFRDALFAVSHVSYEGNKKHNPGEALHWGRGKSVDEEDAIGRHLAERHDIDPLTEEVFAANLAWRALANLQKVLEAKYNIEPPPGCHPVGAPRTPSDHV